MAASSSEQLQELMAELLRRSHAGGALILAARLERRLALLLQSKMPRLSNTLRKKLFCSRGALAGFSAKIDVAYALNLIPTTTQRDLHAIRDIRNAFAHSNDLLTFEEGRISKLMPKLSATHGLEQAPAERFLAVYKLCRQCIIDATSSNGAADALRDK